MAAGGGSIVNVQSTAAGLGMPGMTVYGATKAVLESLTRTWAAEFAESNVRVSAVAPGPMRTSKVVAAVGPDIGGMSLAAALERISDPAEVPHVIAFVVSGRASCMTGAIVAADGGRTAIRGDPRRDRTMDRLTGKHALITGGTSGIGLETAREFLAEGATVAITGRSQEKLDEAARQLDGPLLTIASDAGDVPGQAALAARLQEEWPKLDILMSNAADVTHLPIEAWTEEAFDRLLATNLKSPFFLIRDLLPLFSQQSSVILVGSVSAYIGHENATVYGAAKAGLLSYTRGLTHELKDRGIRVNGLSPGPTITNAFAPLGPERQAALYEELRRTVPLHRLGTATELAKAAVYLASDESAYTAGTVLRVDGGIGQLAY